MKQEKNLLKKAIYQVLKENKIKIKKIILFGSRAKKKFNQESDWDILIITYNDIDFNSKRGIRFHIRKKLSSFPYGLDIIIKSVNEAKEDKNDKGMITYYAIKEGIIL